METGRTLGPYQILGLLGTGGMGEVHRALDPRLGRQVAIKVLPAEFASEPERLQRFRREAQTVAALNHPNIVTLYSVEEVESTHFITMELVEGQTLRDLIPETGMSPSSFFAIALPLSEAIAAAHAQGITHRDLKPANVMRTHEGRLKVLDFGLAKRAQPAASDATQLTTALETEAGAVFGTVPYMSPEQLQGESSEFPSDVFSLGVMFYEMLVGERPFQGSNPALLISSILRDVPQPLTSRRGSLAPELEEVIGRCLEKEAKARYRTAYELHQALQAVQKRLEQRRAVTVQPTSADELTARTSPPPAARGEAGTVAVLDFVNISADASVDWLTLGIAETVMVDLKKVSSLRVLSREKVVMALRKQMSRQLPEPESTDRAGGGAEEAADPRPTTTRALSEGELVALGERLGIGWIVSGGFQKMGDALRITARLVDVVHGQLIESTKVDGTLGEIFTMQDRVVVDLLQALQLEGSEAGIEKRVHPGTLELEAYECYARGRQFVTQMSPEGFRQGLPYFERAIELDPDYALPYSGLGQLYCMRFIGTTDPKDLEAALEYLEKAVELDPELGDPYLWLAYGHARQARFTQAIEAGQRGVQLEPDNPMAHYFLAIAYWLRSIADHDVSLRIEARRHLLVTTRLAPNYHPGFQILGSIYLMHGLYADARQFLQRAAQIEESGDFEGARFVGALTLLGKLCFREGDLETAQELYGRSLQLVSAVDHVYTTATIAMTHCWMAEIAFRRRQYADAVTGFRRALQIGAASPRSLGTGWFMVRAHLGLAMSFRRLQMRREEEKSLADALALFESREGFDFSGIWEGSEADIHYDLALYQIVSRDDREALRQLEQAAACGWSNAKALEEDRLFEDLHPVPGFQALLDQIRPRQALLS